MNSQNHPNILRTRRFMAAMLLCAVIGLSPLPASAQMPDYVYYYNQGNAFYEKGELTKAIEMYEKALPLAEGQSISVVYNNLAAIYMRRGNYLLRDLKQADNALGDFRRAYFLLEYGWPEGLERSAKQESNLRIARENMQIGYGNVNIDPNNKAVHLDLAKKLRYQGKFQEAIVEYARVHELDANDVEALKSLGDLFNVVNRPDKSRKYYARAVEKLGPKADDELLVRLANAQNKAGEVDNAVASLNRALDLNPENVAALKQLEEIWVRDLRFNPQSVLAHANLAGVLQKKKMFGDALKEYNLAEQLATQDPKTTLEVKKLIRLNIGTLYQQTGNQEMALKAYDTVLQIDPGNKLAHYYKATLYKETGRTGEAIAQFNSLLATDPNHEEAHQALLELIRKQSGPQAETGLKDYANRFSTNPLVLSKVGEEFHAMKNYPEAVGYYRRAIQLKPDLAAAHANLGAALQALDQHQEALASFKTAARLDSGNPTFADLVKSAETVAGQDVYRKAVELQQQGDNQGAIRYYEQALQVAANDTPELRVAYGAALQSANRLPEAVAQYQKAIEKDPNNGNYHYYLATAHHQGSDLAKAMASYQKAVQLPSTEPEARQQAEEAVAGLRQAEVAEVLNQVVAAYERKAYPQALTLIQKALAQDPGNATAYYYQALIYGDQDKLPQSISSYQEALKYDPGFKDAYFGLGVALDKKADKAAARTAFEKFLELSNGQEDDFVKYARERVQSP